MRSARIRTAVVGVGHFGQYHAEKYAALPRSELIAVCDIDRKKSGEIAAAHSVPPVFDYRELLGRVDAVSVAVPTDAHYEVARFFLENAVHVLVEKPITTDLDAADHLIRIAQERGLVLQVGHLERYFAAEIGLLTAVTRPLYAESIRISPFQARGANVGVVLDSMIHDIDMILCLVNADVQRVDAVGAPVLSASEDVANARLRFANGCIANITASRISYKSERKLRIFQSSSYVSVDFLARKMVIARKNGDIPGGGTPSGFQIEEKSYAECDPLERELDSFLETIACRGRPLVSGEDGRRALATALSITGSLQEHLACMRKRFLDEGGL